MYSRIVFLLFLGCLLASGGCKRPGPDGADGGTVDSAPTTKSILVRTVRPTRGSLSDTLPITGRVEAFERADIIPRVEGIVFAILKDEGDPVKKGDILARVDCRERELTRDKARLAVKLAELAVEEAAVSLEEAEARLVSNQVDLGQEEKNLARAKDQHAKGAIADQDLEMAQHAYDLVAARRAELILARKKAEQELARSKQAVDDKKNELARAALECSWADLTATISGTVTRRMLHVGQKAVPNQTAFTIADLDSLVVRPTIPERQLRQVTVGLKALLRTTTWPDKVFHGHVEHISPEVDPQNGSIGLRIRLAPSDPPLRPGMFVSGDIVTEQRDRALLVPKKALVFERDQPFLFVVTREGEDTIVHRVPIERGLENKDMVEVRAVEGSPLRIDDASQIVVVGLDRLFEGAPVVLEDKDSAPAPKASGTDDKMKSAKSGG